MPISLNLKNLLDDSRDFLDLQNAGEYPGGRVLLKVVQYLRDRERGEVEDKPRLCNEDWTKDMRFKLGMIAMANLILDLPDRALKHITHLEGRE